MHTLRYISHVNHTKCSRINYNAWVTNSEMWESEHQRNKRKFPFVRWLMMYEVNECMCHTSYDILRATHQYRDEYSPIVFFRFSNHFLLFLCVVFTFACTRKKGFYFFFALSSPTEWRMLKRIEGTKQKNNLPPTREPFRFLLLFRSQQCFCRFIFIFYLRLAFSILVGCYAFA